ENSEEEVAETMAETMEQYMSKTRANYGSGIFRPKIDDKDHFELNGQFLKELRDNTFSGSDHEDANEHIEKVLEILEYGVLPSSGYDVLDLVSFVVFDRDDRYRNDPIRNMGLKIEIPEFTGKDIPDKLKVKLVAIKLRQHALLWWDHVTKRRRMEGKSKVETWEKMKKLMKAKFLPENHRQ
ncbi:reverse transcriptase domain-containing protein, partial [Tanacetum coccineum]